MPSRVPPVSHPYYPRDLVLPHYVPNDKSLGELLGASSAVVLVCTLALWVLMDRKPHLKNRSVTKMKLCWFLACGVIHSVLEGYFSLYHKTLAGEQTFLAQMWKEYSKGDSRYISSDTFTVCMESITAFIDGPLAFLAVYAFMANSAHRYIIQLALSLCQLYGDVLYFSTEVKEGFSHGEMWHPIYFWFYFFFMNIIWIIVPSICVLESVSNLSKAQVCLDRNITAKKRN